MKLSNNKILKNKARHGGTHLKTQGWGDFEMARSLKFAAKPVRELQVQ